MSRTINDAPLTTREARRRLDVGLHWRSLDADIHLGYRKAKRGGVWLVRWRNGQGYRQSSLGAADDTINVGTLDYRAAVKVAIAQVAEARTEARAAAEGPPLTVRSAVEAYIEVRDARERRRTGREVRSDAARRLEKLVIGRPARGKRAAVAAASLADVPLHKLTEDDLQCWRASLPNDFKPAGVQRVVNDLKAALNSCAERHYSRLPPGLSSTVKRGLRTIVHEADDDDDLVVARENQILSDDQVASLMAATLEVDRAQGWEGDLYRLILAMAASGARFSQVTRLRVMDVQTVSGRLMMPPSRKGRGGKVNLISVPVGRDVLEVLMPIVTGRSKGAPLFERWRYRQQPGTIRWERSSRGPWQTPSEIVRPWGDIRIRAGLPDVIPYALRHSSIVRGIRANLPTRLVAAIHDTSIAMIERHYARYIADGLDTLAAQAIIPLAAGGDSSLSEAA
ncbi:tyrosine-type recombinase/integrase [Novosphingobium pentaromativorans]|uniref:Integrase family protein n=1 Tax=Novosphingobium pentaromativorans US6-1 TaxID=1088721 RepID=G6E732_9SPHN|nr:tyrosine-type recombinase/integrase [Novosphingobium pentaromativorans]AIT81769.1 integrase [Novosphingobium pentaromativorans US6-1]EHJ62859.1 integrase family protein [Novosphingobium pentaromativorans US6-1]